MDIHQLGLLFILWTILVLGTSAVEYTSFKVLLWLSSDAGLDPMTVWQNTGSSYNSATNKTEDDLTANPVTGYRNTMIDDWSNKQPNKIRICYRNDEAGKLFCTTFNSTGSTSQDWFTTSRETKYGCETSSSTFSSYSTSFECANTTTGIHKYRTACLKLSGSSVWYIVATNDKAIPLPATAVADLSSCYLSYGVSNPLAYSTTTSSMYRAYCSSKCRENNHQIGAVHGDTCSCMASDPSTGGGALNVCNHPCDGDSSETCGAVNVPGYPSDAVVFNYVKTDIDTSQFDSSTYTYGNIPVSTAFKEIALSKIYFLSGFDVTVAGTPAFPISVQMKMRSSVEVCSDAVITSATPSTTKNFAVTDNNPVWVEFITTKVQCIHLDIAATDDNGNDITLDATISPKVYRDDQFVTAKYVSVEAAWELEETCECDCWVYNMLHGETPYDNLTYAEIEVALFNITERIRKELTVNTSSLSATIRKRTSADDARQSATAVGYGLGVALLTLTFGGLFLSDASRLFSSLQILKNNVMSRFTKDPSEVVPEPESREYSLLNTPKPD